ncbi:hypothetical protein [Flavobacterium restrictum]|uniref:Uncharacterized protein n=1 Tax=Flavobacterium restrictum TaxID=2594428 RepID=A0A553E2I2_9FLAO|nr:hypothetical protein [Flavobacterium restrictum]TRX39238.1 hypothetical protein FNW21_09895 [Flavobacterium restrictum]
MEHTKIERLLEKYFQGETSIAQEKELTNYFSGSDVAQHLEQYKPLFGYFSLAKEQTISREIQLKTKKSSFAWLSIAASVVVLLGVGMYVYTSSNPVDAHEKLGTYTNPDEAFKATQKALALLSNHVNTGIGSVQYIQEYDNSKDEIFTK